MSSWFPSLFSLLESWTHLFLVHLSRVPVCLTLSASICVCLSVSAVRQWTCWCRSQAADWNTPQQQSSATMSWRGSGTRLVLGYHGYIMESTLIHGELMALLGLGCLYRLVLVLLVYFATHSWNRCANHLCVSVSPVHHSAFVFIQAENDLNELRALMHSPNAIVVSSLWTGWHSVI